MPTYCVTGASGFIARVLIAQLLDQGHKVRGTVRSLKNEDKLAPLRAIPGADAGLELFEANLMDDGSFDEVVQGCDGVFHTASPYSMNVEDPDRDLVQPAIRGTVTVLESCVKEPSVKRVVLTSSMAAIQDSPEDKTYTEEDWNETSTLKRNPYYFSKAEAERAAWKFVEDEARNTTGFDLVVINPVLVIGPEDGKGINPSNDVFKQIIEGAYPAIIDVAFGIVSVDDVARAHVLGMEKADAKGRHLCSANTLHLRDICDILSRTFPNLAPHLPKKNMSGACGTALVKLSTYVSGPKTQGVWVRTNIGRWPYLDTSKIRNELGLEFAPLEDSIRDAVLDMLRQDKIKLPKKLSKEDAMVTAEVEKKDWTKTRPEKKK